MTFEEEVAAILEMQKAPPGKFRVLCVDSFSNPPLGEPFVLADCDNKEAAREMAKAHRSEFQEACVYDENGHYIG